MWILAILPFCLQGICIGIDEGYFHYKRGLPFWEKIGHPIDTLSLLACLIITVTMPFNDFNLKLYIGLSILSCLMVTKDEFVHKEHCPGSENWLHALLFTLHPITLISAGLIWPVTQGIEMSPWIMKILDNPQALESFLFVQTIAIALFMFYQIIFWNFIWKNKPVIKM